MQQKTLSGIVLDEHTELTLTELCHACCRSAEWVIELVDYGALQPVGRRQTEWRFPASSLQRARTAMRLQRDLGINMAGVALALDLLDEIESLRSRLYRFDVDDR